jgi:fumarate reductase flavoprotein subunit
MSDVDILIVGAGLAGLAAANAAYEAGCERILIAESEAVVGGSSRLSGGIVMGAGTKMQRQAGISDDPDTLFHDYMSINQWQVDGGVVRRLADEAGPTVDWLADLGVEFHAELIYGGDERVPRCVGAKGGGQGLVDALHRRTRERSIDIALGQRVDRLLTEDGAVGGAAVADDEIRAGAVVLTTGGFGANQDRLKQLYPDAITSGDWSWYIGADGSRGDGLDLASSVDAQVIGHNRGLRLLHPNFVRTIEAYLPAWTVLVNRQGRRFADESAPYGLMNLLVRAQGDVVFAIFDDALIHPERAIKTKDYKQAFPGVRKMKSPNWNPIMVEEMIGKGRIQAAESIPALAAQLGLPTHLAGTIERYNAGLESGVDDFAKPIECVRPVVTPPFYGAEVRPATLCLTACGVRIDREARVLNESGSAVKGLYAAGEITGGVVGDLYVGSGNSLSNCATIGRVAGTEAAAFVRNHARA